MTGEAEKLVEERKKTHGVWADQARTTYALKQAARAQGNWHLLPVEKTEAIDMIFTKISRIICGDATHTDHWDDIAGYAILGRGRGHP